LTVLWEIRTTLESRWSETSRDSFSHWYIPAATPRRTTATALEESQRFLYVSEWGFAFGASLRTGTPLTSGRCGRSSRVGIRHIIVCQMPNINLSGENLLPLAQPLRANSGVSSRGIDKDGASFRRQSTRGSGHLILLLRERAH
jgi:hypothetical protein